MLPLDRREVFRYAVWALAGAISAAMAAVVGLAVVAPLGRKHDEDWLDVAPVEQLGQTPQRYSVTYVSRQGWHETSVQQGVYAFRTAAGQPVVLSSVCSHLGCRVRWDDQQRQFLCPCHGGVYDAAGNVLAGPPSGPLNRPQVRLEAGVVRIKRT